MLLVDSNRGSTPCGPASSLTHPLKPSCPRLDAPIVLAHGLFGFRRIGLGPLTLTWYFRGIPGILQAAGNRVLVTRVHPTAGVARRAKRLGEQILEAFPDEPVHLIGHSMGGLDARALIADPAWKGRVLSLTTIATPHLGSGIADFAKLRVGRIYTLLEKLGVEHQGFLDVTPGVAAEFNRRNPLPDWLPVFSVAGDPPHEEVSWPLRRLHVALEELEGPNDGLVSVASATAFGQPSAQLAGRPPPPDELAVSRGLHRPMPARRPALRRGRREPGPARTSG